MKTKALLLLGLVASSSPSRALPAAATSWNSTTPTAMPRGILNMISFQKYSLYSLPVGMTKAQIIIVNSMGMKVATYELSGKEGQKVFDLRNLCPGVYTYRACCGKYSLTGKLVIVK